MAGILAVLFFGLAEGPEPSWVCGGGSNFRIAVFGYRTGGDVEEACRSQAIRGTIKAVALGGALVVVGSALAAVGARREAAPGPQLVPGGFIPQPRYGDMSADGRWWWDGRQWYPTQQLSGGGEDGDDPGPG